MRDGQSNVGALCNRLHNCMSADSNLGTQLTKLRSRRRTELLKQRERKHRKPQYCVHCLPKFLGHLGERPMQVVAVVVAQLPIRSDSALRKMRRYDMATRLLVLGRVHLHLLLVARGFSSIQRLHSRCAWPVSSRRCSRSVLTVLRPPSTGPRHIQHIQATNWSCHAAHCRAQLSRGAALV